MLKIAIIIATLLPITAFAVMSVVPPGMQLQDQSRSGSVIGTHGARASDQLSMGPDPGGKTGATVTSTTTKTGQPTADGAGTSNQSSSTGAPVTTPERPVPNKPATGGSDASKR